MSTLHTKQVIVMRKDLNMRKGKMCAQAAHASIKVILDLMKREESWITIKNIQGCHRTMVVTRTLERFGLGPFPDPLNSWLDGIFTKVCVGVSSEEELNDIYQKAQQEDLPCALIEDNGLTEFKGVKTKTCCAIGPWWADEIDKITSHLKLL